MQHQPAPVRDSSADADNDQPQRKFRFFKENGYWYMEREGGLRFGPFDCMYHTFMGEYKHQQEEISEPRLSAVLAPYV